MLMLILLLMMPAPQAGGTVILNTKVPEAEFYLDANFVAVTDKNGTLTMENFPAGTFTYSVVKKGYKSYKDSFSILEGETRQLSPVLERIRETKEPDRKPVRSSRESRSLAKKSPIPRSADRFAPEAQQSPAPGPIASAPASTQTAGDTESEESRATSPLFVLVVLLLIASAGVALWIRTKKRVAIQIPLPETDDDIETPGTPADAPNRPDPQFIEELRRREELLNAGYVGNNSRVADKESMKDKEVVIVLPKEAFHYEEDK
jgi:hypothetical protein